MVKDLAIYIVHGIITHFPNDIKLYKIILKYARYVDILMVFIKNRYAPLERYINY